MGDDVLVLIYLFMSLDGNISEDELKIYKKLVENKGVGDKYLLLIEKAKKELDKMIEEDDREFVVFDYLARKLLSSDEGVIVGNTVMNNKELLWTFINLGFADGEYCELERKFVRRLSIKLNIDKSYVPEMEDIARTLIVIQNEKEQLETLTMPYAEANKIMNNIDENMDAVKTSLSVLFAY